jgi:dipeptidyl aminopeptidase/acylaminoacyl peptidase
VPISLGEARKRHVTHLKERGPAPAKAAPEAPTGVKVVHYESAGRKLLAWLAIPEGKGPFPGVLYAHGGHALEPNDYKAARPLVEAGFAVLLPAWRGENGNPGHYEYCYGEVDDAEAAVGFLANLPEVNSKELFAVGHDTGATIVMLLAELSPRLKGVAACGGLPDLRGLLEDGTVAIENLPFDENDPVELDLRSPARHVKDLQCPLLLYYAERGDEPYFLQAMRMQEDVDKYLKDVRVERVEGTDHLHLIDRVLPRIVRFMRWAAKR